MTYYLYRSLEPEKYLGPSTSKAFVPPPRKPSTPVPQASSSKEEPLVRFESKAIFFNEEPVDFQTTDSSESDSAFEHTEQESQDTQSLPTSASSEDLADLTNLLMADSAVSYAPVASSTEPMVEEPDEPHASSPPPSSSHKPAKPPDAWFILTD